MPNIFTMLRSAPATRAFAVIEARDNAAPCILRDNITRHEIARGTYEHCAQLQRAFGSCYIDAI